MIIIMTRAFRKALIRSLIAVVLLAPSFVLARSQEPERDLLDARYEGYSQVTTLESNSSAMTWVLLIILGAVTVMGLFKNSKRTHLD